MLCGNWGLLVFMMKEKDVDLLWLRFVFVDRSMSHLPSLIGEDMSVVDVLH